MMAQYRRIKSGLPHDALLLFRLGDFYELFFEDAVTGAQLLNLALTRRNGVPMCGLPYHAAPGYIGRLLRHGRKVALCDQAGEARPGRLVEREVTAILSPGTHFDERLLHADRNNFLAAACFQGGTFGLACVDLTTGDFRVTETDDPRAFLAEVERLRPAELLHPAESADLKELVETGDSGTAGASRGTGPQRVAYEDWTFQQETAVFTLRDHFKVASLDGYGLRQRAAATGAAGAVLHYLVHQLRRDVTHLTRLTYYGTGDHLVLDAVSLRNLEILEPLRADARRDLTLFAAVNRTATPMGARRLRDWLTQPLASVAGIEARQEAVAAWQRSPETLAGFRARLAEVRDLERTLSRLSLGSGNARDLVALRIALEQVPGLCDLVVQAAAKPRARELIQPEPVAEAQALLGHLAADLADLPALVDLLKVAIQDEPPLTVREGGMIRDGYSPELDALRAAARGGREWLAQLQQEESARTGIPSLKVGFNSVFGYYLEVTRAHLSKVPLEWVRKQTVSTGERFITEALKAMESRILGADERATRLEHDLFQQVRSEVLGELRRIQGTALAVGQLDVLASFAETARTRDWVRPEVGDAGLLRIRDGRHPVLDSANPGERFVPNDTDLDPAASQIALITGPNMAGKSTYIRQVALLALLAHTGACVPAGAARVDLLDRIFTRIGASDDLARGQSTFMVEMSETANILNNATRRSLVILDEIGRGTSTFDGLSLAWSIVEHLHHQVGAKTLFATHYHELTELGSTPVDPASGTPAPAPGPPVLARVRNFHVAVREYGEQLVFLRKVQPGATDKSHGIQVARLAGVPPPVIARAREILRVLEEAELNLQAGLSGGTPADPAEADGRRRRARREPFRRLQPGSQLDLFLGGT
ncbi:MAG: DNA mismatch repair protein MutS [Verrucomicrobiae bacterium]|nr:DNA mismatch repair protein MutS [Verrucomicrobiae bacterium]